MSIHQETVNSLHHHLKSISIRPCYLPALNLQQTLTRVHQGRKYNYQWRCLSDRFMKETFDQDSAMQSIVATSCELFISPTLTVVNNRHLWFCKSFQIASCLTSQWGQLNEISVFDSLLQFILKIKTSFNMNIQQYVGFEHSDDYKNNAQLLQNLKNDKLVTCSNQYFLMIS